MSQADTLRALDRTLHGAFLAAGLADSGVVRGISCDLYLDRDAQFFGDDQAAVAGLRTTVTFRKDQAPGAERGDRVVVGSEAWLLAEIVEEDESLAVWAVVRD
jgi:hypothetical protein